MKNCFLSQEDIKNIGKKILIQQVIIADKNFKIKHIKKEIKNHFDTKIKKIYIFTFKVFNACL